jgi:hypothetical protein
LGPNKKPEANRAITLPLTYKIEKVRKFSGVIPPNNVIDPIIDNNHPNPAQRQNPIRL